MLPLMAVIPSHENPIGKQDCVDTWRGHGRMCVPTRGNHIIDVLIVAIYETTAVNGLPLDLLIEAQTAENDPIKQFGVIFSEKIRPIGHSTGFLYCGARRGLMEWGCGGEGSYRGGSRFMVATPRQY